MATKAKRKPKAISQTPITPPQSIGEVLVQSCMADLNDKRAADYAVGIYRRDEMSEKERKAFCEAMHLFAVLGWTYWNYQKESATP